MATAMPAGMQFSSYQKRVLALLAFLQFSVILDFMTLSPLGAFLMPQMHINTAQFGVLVSSYAYAAGVSGFLTAGFADRFDRKRLLMFFYVGFLIGTLLCGLARTYTSLLLARTVTGLFAGVIGSVVFAIITDLFAFHQRGRVMGIVQTAFSASSVAGIPVGLYLANHWGWNAAFLLIAAICAVVGTWIVVAIRPINAHLALRPDRSPLHHLLHTFSQPRYLVGFSTTILLSTGGFILQPYASAFSVNNLGITLAELPLVYMLTGAFSIVTGPLLGRLCDAIGNFPVFLLGAIATIIMVIIYTHLAVTPLVWVVVVNCLMWVGISSRMISSSALVSAIPTPTDRGSYMAISSSIQQVSGGVAAMVGGMIVTQTNSGLLLHFDMVGYVLVGTTLITLLMMYFISRMVGADGAQPVVAVDSPLA
ncbi:MAG TPA: MFS transporter [Steroidobacteraceae bacterium]|jgi:predicted MFS family arabinose efflux permease|nr:MFS transporter [Steroidobacteraceae bacterium]